MAKKMSQSDRKKLIIAISAMALVVVVLVLVTLFSRRGEKVPSNPEGTVGNIAGNINNGGIVCESDGRIYFSNPYDGGALYSMNSDETDCKKVSTAVASSICVAGNYVYYFQSGSSGASGLGGVRVPNSFIRSHIDGQHGYTMSRDVVVRAQVVGDYVYMEGTADNKHNYPYFQRMPIGGGDAELLARYGINPSCVVGNIIYYNNTESNHYLMAYNTVTKNTYEVLEGNIWNPVYDSGYIYYMAPEDGYQLRRYSLNDQTIEILTNERVESFNVYNGYIYYQTMGNDAHLAFMLTNGESPTILAYGNYNSISMTSKFIYFKDYWSETSLYHTYYGSGFYEPVNAAVSAAIEEIDKANK